MTCTKDEFDDLKIVIDSCLNITKCYDMSILIPKDWVGLSEI